MITVKAIARESNGQFRRLELDRINYATAGEVDDDLRRYATNVAAGSPTNATQRLRASLTFHIVDKAARRHVVISWRDAMAKLATTGTICR